MLHVRSQPYIVLLAIVSGVSVHRTCTNNVIWLRTEVLNTVTFLLMLVVIFFYYLVENICPIHGSDIRHVL